MTKEYLEFIEVPWEGKTKRILVQAKKDHSELGKIQWYPGWRQYVFMPCYPTVWSWDCLERIQKFIRYLNLARKVFAK